MAVIERSNWSDIRSRIFVSRNILREASRDREQPRAKGNVRDNDECKAGLERGLQRASIEMPGVPWHFTFIPSSHEIQRSPLVKKQATACLARWCIQPSSLNWVMIASIHGNPVWPCVCEKKRWNSVCSSVNIFTGKHRAVNIARPQKDVSTKKSTRDHRDHSFFANGDLWGFSVSFLLGAFYN